MKNKNAWILLCILIVLAFVISCCKKEPEVREQGELVQHIELSGFSN